MKITHYKAGEITINGNVLTNPKIAIHESTPGVVVVIDIMFESDENSTGGIWKRYEVNQFDAQGAVQVRSEQCCIDLIPDLAGFQLINES